MYKITKGKLNMITNFNTLENRIVTGVLKASKNSDAIDLDTAAKYFRDNKADLDEFAKTGEVGGAVRNALIERVNKLTTHKAKLFCKNSSELWSLFPILKQNKMI